MQNCGVRLTAGGHFFGDDFGGVDEIGPMILTQESPKLQKTRRFILTWAGLVW